MQEKQLALLCAAAALLGIILLAAYSRQVQPQKMEIAEITDTDVGKPIAASGSVASIYSRNGNWFLTLCSRTCIKAFVPAGTAKKMNASVDLRALKKGAWISFGGRVQEYKGELELTALDGHAIEVLRP